jgi:hypothetical protein
MTAGGVNWLKKVYNQKIIKSSQDDNSRAVCPDKRRRPDAIVRAGKANPLCPALGVHGIGGTLEGTDGAVNFPPFACQGSLSEYVKEAKEVFGSYGFIVTTHNSDSYFYGYEYLYYIIQGRIDYNKIKCIKDLRGGKKRLYLYEMGLIDEKEVYEWFDNMVYRQNNEGAGLVNSDGKHIIAQDGRFCNKRGKRSLKLQKQFKEGIGEISDCILLTLTTHEKEVLKFMPENTNLFPVQFATINIGTWISKFLDRLRKYQKNRSIPWEFVGWTIEFQEGKKKKGSIPRNGFPHVHMIFRGRWIGNIQEVAKLWPYCEAQGVDYMTKAKYEKKLISQGKLKSDKHVSGIRLINYITAYVSKCSKAVITKGHKKDKLVGVHKGYAWLAFGGGRMFNVARDYKKSFDKEVCADPREEKEIWKYEGVRGFG